MLSLHALKRCHVRVICCTECATCLRRVMPCCLCASTAHCTTVRYMQARCMQKTTSKAKRRRNASRLRLQPSVALCSHCGAVFAPHELLPKDKRFCIGECGIPRDLMMKQSHGGMKMQRAKGS